MLPSRPSFVLSLDPEQKEEFTKWFTQSNGPWKDDLINYPDNYTEDIELTHEQKHRGIERAYIFRNDYLAWCGGCVINEKHKLYDLSFIEQSKRVKVHGGLSEGVRKGENGILGFDCNHAKIDQVPYMQFISEKNDKRRIGNLGNLNNPSTSMNPNSSTNTMKIPQTASPFVNVVKASPRPGDNNISDRLESHIISHG